MAAAIFGHQSDGGSGRSRQSELEAVAGSQAQIQRGGPAMIQPQRLLGWRCTQQLRARNIELNRDLPRECPNRHYALPDAAIQHRSKQSFCPARHWRRVFVPVVPVAPFDL